MAYVVTSKSPTEVKNVGLYENPRKFIGVVATVGNSATVTIPGAKAVLAVFMSVQGTTTTQYISATTANSFTITTTGGSGTEAVMWEAYAKL